jgi:tetratricopeptide (TPR) repeat protein
MKLLTRILNGIYHYATIFVVVGAPLFFIPKTGFSGEVTYQIMMMILVTVALVSYVLKAIITKSWQSVTRLEFFSYIVFSVAVLLSVLFSKNPQLTFIGEGFNPSSGAAMLTLPVILYLTRSLPESVRRKLKFAIIGILGAASFVFISALIFGGSTVTFTRTLFSGFSSSLSFATYLGLFSVVCLFLVVFVHKTVLSKKSKAVIVVTAFLFVAWIVTLSSQTSVRPNLTSTALVAKKTLLNEGLFGIGSGNFARAWQLHKPQDVINSQYFGYDFNEGSDTMTTMSVTLGIFGLLAFMSLVLSALYSTFVSYRQNKTGEDHFILGLLSVVLLYFVVVAWVVPLSYSMLVMWMVVSALGMAKAHLTEFHPSKKLAFLFIPIALLLTANTFVTLNKVHAYSLFNSSQKTAKIEDAEALVKKAADAYPFDGFYRTLVEYAITSNRNLLSTNATDQELLKNTYLKKAQTAVDYALIAIKINPSNYQNYVTLGRAYELAIPFDKETAFTKAKKSYEEAIKLYPENPYLYLMLARLETSAGTREGVRTQLTEALRKKQNFADALYLMSQLEASESKIEEAIGYAIETIKSAPNDPAAYVQAGLLFYGKASSGKGTREDSQKDYANAVLAFKSALERDPNNANIAYFLALALRDGGEPSLAKPLADELLRRNPGNADLEAFLTSLSPAPQVVPVSQKTANTKTATTTIRKK